MNILIINQPVGNRGDESAHRALMHSLVNKYPTDNIKVAFFGDKEEDVHQININADNVQYVVIKAHKGIVRLARFVLIKSVWKVLMSVDPPFRKMNKLIKSADIVITAPGGICLGAFHNWIHLLWLVVADNYKKPMAYYSRSFGPFYAKSSVDTVFNKLSINMLRKCRFLSIRDDKTILIAKDLKLKYISSIDTAFLEKPAVDIPHAIVNLISSDQYMVFVPNSLRWHPAYVNASQEKIEEFYLSIIETVINRFGTLKIVMMPQLYGSIPYRDYIYFKVLQSKSKYSDKIIVLEDHYSSDIQQSIISKAAFVIGARYHSIVFAINNARPFISLSYEHKMFGLLSRLNLETQQIDITNLGTSSFDVEKALQDLSIIISKEQLDCDMISERAYNIALDCFTQLCTNFIDKH